MNLFNTIARLIQLDLVGGSDEEINIQAASGKTWQIRVSVSSNLAASVPMVQDCYYQPHNTLKIKYIGLPQQ